MDLLIILTISLIFQSKSIYNIYYGNKKKTAGVFDKNININCYGVVVGIIIQLIVVIMQIFMLLVIHEFI